MRVLLTNHFPFHGSGTGTYTLDLARGLLRAGHEVQALVVDCVGAGDEPFAVLRVVCKPDDPAADLPFEFPCFTSHPLSRNTFYDLSDAELALYREANRRRLDQVIDKFDPQIIHCQHIWVQGQLALETGVPYVLSAQGTDLMGYRRDRRYRALAQQAAENAGRILAASDYIGREVIATFQRVADRVETVLSAVEIEPYRRPSPERSAALRQLGLPEDCPPIVAYAGKLVPFKGVDTLLNAAAIYEDAAGPLATVIAGGGPLEEELTAQAIRLGLERVWFLGDRGRDDCAALYHLAEIVVMPSRAEPFGLVALEAMASGTPLIGTRAGGLPEIVSDATGGLVPVDDHELLAEMVLCAIREDWKRGKGPAAAAYVLEHHHPDRWIARIVGIYDQVLAARRAVSQ